MGAGADSTIIVCKDAPCTNPNAPGDHMTDLQVPTRNIPYPADGRFTYPGLRITCQGQYQLMRRVWQIGQGIGDGLPHLRGAILCQ